MYFAFTFFGKQPQLMYAKKTGLVSALSSLSVLLNAAAMWFFAARYGAVGAAIGTVIAGVLTTSLSVSVSQRYYRIEYERAKLLLIYAYFFCGLAATCVLQAAELAYPVRVAVKVAIMAGYGWIGAGYGWWAILLRDARRVE
jgi:O-antigen/teichoic acid export membrane protein